MGTLNITTHKKYIAILIDPGKLNICSISQYIEQINLASPDLILIGGSQSHNNIEDYVLQLKQHTDIPIYLFPGHSSQFTPHTDGILLISLLSGRNPEFLIGQHVKSALEIAKSGIDVIPTAYILICGGKQSAVATASNTTAIPQENTEEIIRTAKAGELLGFKMVYLEAGSGALQPIPPHIISAVRKTTHLPLIVGGGIKTKAQIDDALNAGADIIVIGNHFEQHPSDIRFFTQHTHSHTKI